MVETKPSAEEKDANPVILEAPKAPGVGFDALDS
jgi:hypothetical protein